MKRIYKNNDITFNLTINDFPYSPELVDDVEFKFYTQNKGNCVVKTKADIKNDILVLEWNEISKFEQGVLFYTYNISSTDTQLGDNKMNTVQEVMTDYYIMTGNDVIEIETTDAKWGKITGDIESQTDLISYIDLKVKGVDNIYLKKADLPKKVSAFENDANYLTQHLSLADYSKTTDVDKKLSGKADKVHTHSQYLTQHLSLSEYSKKTEVDLKLSGKADKVHTHDQYLTQHLSLADYSKTKDVDLKLSGKADKVHTHDQYLTQHLSLDNYYTKDQVNSKVATKQDTLVSKKNIKTINNIDILGEGNIVIEGGSGGGGVPDGGYYRKLFESVGAKWNGQYYELNGITDLTEEEMINIYTEGFKSSNRYTTLDRAFAWYPHRTNVVMASHSLQGISTLRMFEYSKIQVAKLHLNVDPCITTNAERMFAEAKKLKELCSPLTLRFCSKPLTGTFSNCVSLVTCKLMALKMDVSFEDSPLLSNESLIYTLENAENTVKEVKDITVTLHEDTYNRAILDTLIQNALNTNGHILLENFTTKERFPVK